MEDYKFFSIFCLNDRLYTPVLSFGSHIFNQAARIGVKLFPARESLVSDIPAGDGKIANLFLQNSLICSSHTPFNTGKPFFHVCLSLRSLINLFIQVSSPEFPSCDTGVIFLEKILKLCEMVLPVLETLEGESRAVAFVKISQVEAQLKLQAGETNAVEYSFKLSKQNCCLLSQVCGSFNVDGKR
jgi:hypothetical protein